MLYLASCKVDEGGAPSGALAGAPRAIINGVEATNRFPFVGRLVTTEGSQFFCSGSLIAPDVVLTAAHCLLDQFDIGVPPGIVTFQIEVPDSTTVLSSRLKAIRTHKYYNGFSFERTNDLALARLETPIDLAALGFEYGQIDETLVDGQTVTIIGYGLNENGEFGVKRTGEAAVEEFLLYGGPGELEPQEFILVASGEIPQVICFGDSGGPVLSASGRIVGVNSKVFVGDEELPQDQCATGGFQSIHENAVFYRPWIDREIALLRGETRRIVTGADAGGGPHVKLFGGFGLPTLRSFFAYNSGFRGGVRVALGDFNGDGTDDIVTGAGPGGGPHVTVRDGRTGTVLHSFFAYGVGFTGGVYVAAADFNSDGTADIVTGAGAGGGPHVKIFDGRDLTILSSFFAFEPEFRGGVRVAAGRIENAFATLVVTPGPGRKSEAVVYAYGSEFLIEPFPGFTSGLHAGLGPVNGSGTDQIILGADTFGGPHFKVYDALLTQIQSQFAFEPTFNGGIRVGAGDADGDGVSDILVHSGPGKETTLRGFRLGESQPVLERTTYPNFFGGGFVGGN